jgi:putative addiction module component (TIGR02574 family)
MKQQTNELAQKALTLPVDERLALVRVLIESLEEASDVDVERAWEDAISRRIHDLDSGKVSTVSWEEIRERIAARIDHRE